VFRSTDKIFVNVIYTARTCGEYGGGKRGAQGVGGET
jgi:hypothetical protein